MRAEVAALTSDLVAIDSVNPALIAGGAGEGEIATFVAGWAARAGLSAERLEATPGRPERDRPRAAAPAAAVRCCSARTSTPSASRA